jgi:hypothetical protein
VRNARAGGPEFGWLLCTPETAARRKRGDRPVSRDPRPGGGSGQVSRSRVAPTGGWLAHSPNAVDERPVKSPGSVFEALLAAARARLGHLHFATPCSGFTGRAAYRKAAFFDGPSRSVHLGVQESERLSSHSVNCLEHEAICAARVGAPGRDRALASGRSSRSDPNTSSDWWATPSDPRNEVRDGRQSNDRSVESAASKPGRWDARIH